MDIDDTKNPFGDGGAYRGVDDGDEIGLRNLNPYDSSSRRGSEDHRTYEETSFTTGGDERTSLLDEEVQENIQEAAKILESKFPKWTRLDSSFNATLNKKGEVVVTLSDTKNAKPHVIIDSDGNVKKRGIESSKKIKKSLGPPAEDIIRIKEEEISRRGKKQTN